MVAIYTQNSHIKPKDHPTKLVCLLSVYHRLYIYCLFHSLFTCGLRSGEVSLMRGKPYAGRKQPIN